MPDKTKEYLAKAQWCEQQASEVPAPETRRVYLELARGWRELAAKPLVRAFWPIEVELAPPSPERDERHRDSILEFRELPASSS